MNNIKNLDASELSQVILEYIREVYDYDYADDFGDEINIHLHNGKCVTISIYLNLEEVQE